MHFVGFLLANFRDFLLDSVIIAFTSTHHKSMISAGRSMGLAQWLIHKSQATSMPLSVWTGDFT